MLQFFSDAAGLAPRDVAVRAGETLFRAGDPVLYLYAVRSGGMQLRRIDADGGVAVMQRAEPDMVLAESSVFSDTYHCDAVAVADSALCRIRRADLRRAASADPRVMEEVARHLAREVQRTRVRVEVLARKTVRERLDAWLALGGAWPARGALISVALDIGVTPEAFYRELQRRRVAGDALGQVP